MTDERTKAYQRLCDWRHNVGSTAIALIMSLLQCADSNQEVTEMANMLLENFSFLYESLDTRKSEGAFRSQFMLQLLNMTHLQSTNSAMQNAAGPSPFDYCGIIGLCGAAVRVFALNNLIYK